MWINQIRGIGEMERKLEGKQRKRVMDLKCVKVRETRLGSRVTNTHKWRMENWKNEWKEQKKKKISGTWMLEQKIQRVCKWETPRWFSIGNLILPSTIPINGEYYPFRFRITKLPTIRFVFVHRLVIKVYTRGGVQFREQSSDLT